MDRKLRFFKYHITLCLLLLLSCNTNEFVSTKNIFERSSKADSLSYYFPSILNDTIKRRDSSFQDFEQKWYSSSLYSFKEPILYTKSDSSIIYRLLWLRSFHEPVCFSVKEYKGNYFLSAKILDRQPSFYLSIIHEGIDKSTGKEILDTTEKADRFALIKFDTIKVLTSRQWREIENSISKLNFWKSPVADPFEDNSTDGANWILEGRKNGHYHFINRRNARGELMDLGRYLIKLSGSKIKEDTIY